MEETKRMGRNTTGLLELYPTFRARLAATITDMESEGLRPRIQDAWRSPADQLKAFETGHSERRYGFHNVTGANGEKESLAVDMLDDDAPLAPSTSYLLRLAAAAQRQGLITGIRWGLKPAMQGAVDNAIRTQEWDAKVKVGWDPTHVQPTGITPARAQAGGRPT